MLKFSVIFYQWCLYKHKHLHKDDVFCVRQVCSIPSSWSVNHIFGTCSLCKSSFLLLGEKSCDIWSSAGRVVQRGSSFKVFCTFHCECKGPMKSGHPPTPQSHKAFNSTTIYLNVLNITKKRTFSCECACTGAQSDPCGLDILAGCEYESKEQGKYPFLKHLSHWKVSSCTFDWLI